MISDIEDYLSNRFNKEIIENTIKFMNSYIAKINLPKDYSGLSIIEEIRINLEELLEQKRKEEEEAKRSVRLT